MTVAATATFEATANELIDRALENVGAKGVDGTATTNQRVNARHRLNLLFKGLDRGQRPLWRVDPTDVTVAANASSVTLSTEIIDVKPLANWRASGETTRTTVRAASDDFWISLPDQTATADAPTQFNVQIALSGLTLRLYPVPTVAGTLEIQAFKRGKDFISGVETPDLLQRGQEILLLGLTWMLAPAYGRPYQEIAAWKAQFEEAKASLLADENQTADVQFVPYGW